MIEITLPDGNVKNYSKPPTLNQIASDVGSGLHKAAVAAKVDGNLFDLSQKVFTNANVSIITPRDIEGLEIIRHSTAHLLAHAVKKLFPDAQVTIGPVIKDGFYYDFSYKRSFTPDDLDQIEKKMAELANSGFSINRKILKRAEAISLFRDKGEIYKTKIVEEIEDNEELSIYEQDDFIDLCRGPHVPSTSKLKVFKLMKVSGAYWKGKSSNEMLQRIYGTAWASKDDLEKYIYKVEESERRDHRKIAKNQDLFHFQDEAPGMVFWHPKGLVIWHQIERYMRGIFNKNGYSEVKCPQVLDVELWKKSGHWDNFRENMFFTGSEDKSYAIKPMNCPGHIQIFNNKLRSHKDLPIRYAEFGICHRDEPSGALHGMMRVRSFTQDDGHIFCTINQLESEVIAFHNLAIKVYDFFGFKNVEVKLALRPEKRLGSDDVWDKAENSLRNALKKSNFSFEELSGEGAFYGPKIEYHLQDSIGRSWQCGTVQIDFMMAKRLNASYVSEKDEKLPPVMIHRAILGSLERFIGILIENYDGALPFWLCPIQVCLINISKKQEPYLNKIMLSLKNKGVRVVSDTRNEKISYKIREQSLQRIPFLCIVGDQEMERNTLSVRLRGKGDIGSLTFEDFCLTLEKEMKLSD